MNSMRKCPNKEDLERLVEGSLTEERNEDILSHLIKCESCSHFIREIIDNEWLMLKEIMKAPHARGTEKAFACDMRIPKVILTAYALGSLEGHQLRLVESHLEKCDNCLSRVIEIQKHIALAPDLNLAISNDVVKITLKTIDGKLALISQSGKACVPLNLKNSGTLTAANSDVFPVKKNFNTKDMLVEVAFKKASVSEDLTMRVSVMRQSNELPSFERSIKLSVSGRQIAQKTTSINGMAEFEGLCKGKYTISVEEQPIAEVELA